jgi:hypothetical protein
MYILKPKEISDIQNKCWELDCSQIKLTRNLSDVSFEGPGFIKLLPNGKLSFKLYNKTSVSPVQGLRWLTGFSKIITQEKYYNLTATDSYGRKWQAENVLPYHSGPIAKSNTIVSGNIHTEIKSVSTVPYKLLRSQLSFICLGKYEIPCNTITTEYVDLNGKPEDIGGSLDTAKFSVKNLEFHITNKEGLFSINIESEDAAIPDYIGSKTIEALMFLIGRPVNWGVSEKHAGGIETIIIRPIRSGNEQIYPPIRFSDPKRQDYWQLYSKYFDYVCSNPEKFSWHPVSILLHRIIEAKATSIENQCLILCIAIEGTLRIALPKLATPTKDLFEWLSKIKESVGKLEMPEDLSNRFGGVINSMKRASASDKLRELLIRKVITNKEFQTWKSLRNSTTHPESAFMDDYEKAIEALDTMLTLFYKLTFYCIGYTGIFTDYSEIKPAEKIFPQV